MAQLVGGDTPFAMRLAMQMLPGRAKIAHWLVHGLNAAWKMGLFHFGSDADAPVDATDVPPSLAVQRLLRLWQIRLQEGFRRFC